MRRGTKHGRRFVILYLIGGETMENVPENLISVAGSVESVLFRNADNGYTVLDLASGGDLITVVGELGNVEEGEQLRVLGEYVNHPKFGMQFRAQVCERQMPSTSAAIIKYLSSGAVKGIGPTAAKKIVEKFGEKTLEILENEPDRLTAVKGISAKKAEEIGQEFKRISGIRTLMIFLSKYNIRPSTAVSAWKRWGQFSVTVIKENPYVLCRNGIDAEFEKSEEIALSLDFPKNDLRRAAAGIYYVLYKNTFNGHSCLPYDRLMDMSEKFLGVPRDILDSALENELDDDSMAEYEKNGRRFIYLYEYYRAEQYIAERLMLMKSCFINTEEDYSKLIDVEEKSKGITYAEQQRKAVSLALSQGFLILTGGPGTGKTTALKAMISLYEQRGMKVMICAPTGRAAKRISDLTGYPAKTVHRLLEVMYDAGGLKFKHNENNPVQCDVMIIDEMSMVDSLLFESLLRALKLSCRLIMVGDSDQLPSVGAGNLLKDMTECGRLPVVRLTEIFRQAQKSAIITNAHRIINGEMPVLDIKDSDFFFMQRLDIYEAAELVSELCCERLPNAYGFSPIDDIQVLCPSRKGTLGVAELNKKLQENLNPPSKGKSEIKGLTYIFRDGDKVMQIKNNYDITWKKDGESGGGIFNGDIGTIVKVRPSERTLVIDFEGRIAEYSFDMTEQLELAYAVTVHKSQGSEFNAVILPIMGGFEKLCYRNLLYTAVTRAKKLLIIVGSKNAVEKMAANNRRTLRYSCLRDMLEKD